MNWPQVPLRYISDTWCDGPFGSGLASEHYREQGARVVRLQNIRTDGFDATDTAFIDLDYFRQDLYRHEVLGDDILIAGLGDDSNLVGRACVAPQALGPTLVKADCFRFRLNRAKADPRFVAYALSSSAALASGTLSGGSTRQRINLSSMAGRKVSLPRPEVQVSIANFLDKQTVRIDALIAEKERLRGALVEWQAAELSRICFEGDGDVIATGNSWIPALPKGWHLSRLKHLVLGIEQGWSPECEARQADDGEWGVLKAGAANSGTFRENEHKALPTTLQPRAELEVKVGDVLVTRASGTAEYVGSFAYVYATRPLLMLSDKNFRLRFDRAPKLMPELLAWMCNTRVLREQVLQYVSGADGLAKNIGSGNLKELWLAVPPLQDQPGIVKQLHARRTQLDGLERHLLEHIDRLREYRSSLISAAVTGQLDISTFKEAA
jgi:type I restriction enzyme S subunit